MTGLSFVNILLMRSIGYGLRFVVFETWAEMKSIYHESLLTLFLFKIMKKGYFLLAVASLFCFGANAQITCPTATEAQAADYYLSNVYYNQCTTLTDTVDSNKEAVKWNGDGFIKRYADGWSDFHWDGTSRVIFDNINMSAAGNYVLTVTYRNSGTVDFIVNDNVTQLKLDGTSPLVMSVALNAGMNTIKFGKNDGWVGFYSIALSECPDATIAQSADWYLNNTYYFKCTALKDTVDGNNDAVKWNGGYIKLNADGWSDYHWDGPSNVIFDNINLSKAGDYKMTVVTRGTGTVYFVVNGDSTELPLDGTNPLVKVVTLKSGMNSIAFSKKADWPGFYSLSLEQATITTTTVTFDKQGGEGGSESVVATFGQAMPEITLPTRANYFFNGYYDAATDGVKYYNADGTSAKEWDKEDATTTLYAQWYDGTPTVDIDVECPDKEAAKAPDYYLSNIYYALCTNWSPVTTTDSVTGRKDLVYDGGSVVLMNNDSNWFKLCGDLKHIDWHWDDGHGKSAIIYDNIFVSADGNYDILWYQQNGGKVDVTVNGDTLGTYSAGKADTLTIYRAPLKAGVANTIKIAKNADWPQSLGIQLQKSSDVVSETLITLDMQGGTGGTETVVAKKGYDMPEITLPIRDGYFFEGYYTDATEGDKYYNADGTSFKAWDKDDKTFTLYAHWNDGSTGGDCPTAAQAISEDWYLSHMYDARCTELTNTFVQDGGAYIYLNAENEKVKITANGLWIDFYYADPSSVVFDSIYVSKDDYYDMKWYFRQDVVDGEATAGSKTQVWVNDELVGEVTTYISDADVELDEVMYEGFELYADYPNKIKLLKVNGWPLTRGIQLYREGSAVENVNNASFFVTSVDGVMTINRLSGESNITIYSISGAQLQEATTTASSYAIPMAPGAYIVNVNGQFAKAVVR